MNVQIESRCILLLIQQHIISFISQSAYQWWHPCLLHHHQECACICSRSRTCTTLPQCKKGSCYLHKLEWSWSYPTSQSHINRQQVCYQNCENTIKQKHSKAIYMRFYMIRDRVKQGDSLSTGNPEVETSVTTSPYTSGLPITKRSARPSMSPKLILSSKTLVHINHTPEIVQ